MDNSDVLVAFEILLEEIEESVDSVNLQASDALKNRDYELSRRLIQQAEDTENFRVKIKDLQNEWRQRYGKPSKTASIPPSESVRKRLQRGLRTSEDAFRLPILAALVDLGGAAPINSVLEHVQRQMKGVLNEYDLHPLSSDPQTPRWRNTAQWCRNALVKDGLMADNSPRGVWEVTPQGRKELAG